MDGRSHQLRPTVVPDVKSIALQISLERAVSLLRTVTAGHRPATKQSLKHFLQRRCVPKAIYTVNPVCLAKTLSLDAQNGLAGLAKEMIVVHAMLTSVDTRSTDIQSAVPASVLERVRIELAKRCRACTSPNLLTPQGLIELCLWLTRVAYERPCLGVDSVIEKLVETGVVAVDDGGKTIYSALWNVSNGAEAAYNSFLSPMELPRIRFPLAITSDLAYGVLPAPMIQRINDFPASRQTALVIVPPPELWALYMEFVMSTHYGEIMRRPPYPHITLLNAFVPKAAIQAVLCELRHALSQIAPFELRFPHLNVLTRGQIVNMDPCSHPPGRLEELQKTLHALMPCNRYRFTKHIGFGPLRSLEHETYFEQFTARWKEISFIVNHVFIMELPDVTEEEELRYDMEWQVLVQGVDRPLGRQVKDARPWTVAAAVPLKAVGDDELPVLNVGQRTAMSEVCPETWKELLIRPMKARLPSVKSACAAVLERSLSSHHQEIKMDRDHVRATQRKTKSRGSARHIHSAKASENHKPRGGRCKPGEREDNDRGDRDTAS